MGRVWGRGYYIVYTKEVGEWMEPGDEATILKREWSLGTRLLYCIY